MDALAGEADLAGAANGEDDELFASTSGKKKARKEKSSKAEAMILKELGKAPALTKGKASAGGGEDSADEEDTDAAAAEPSGPRVLGVSKKDPAVRRKELLSAGGAMGSLAAMLTAAVAERASELIRSQHGSEIVIEAARGGDGGEIDDQMERVII